MKKVASLFTVLLIASFSVIFLLSGSGCANIIPPGGGPRDSLPPLLLSVTPADSSTNVTSNKITFTFNEFVDVQNVSENVLVSPTPNTIPFIDYKLRTVTVKLKDTLQPNTTYSINFGSAIKDVNEGNILKDFTYVFSTGSKVDYNSFSGKIVMAQTGLLDTTLLVVLHRNLTDSAVTKEKPPFITRQDGNGNFIFRNLPAGTFNVYALPNEFSKKYDDQTKPFAFADKPVVIDSNTKPVTLYAYVDSIKPQGVTGVRNAPAAPDKQLKFTHNLTGGRHDIISDVVVQFNKKITVYDSSKVLLTNKDFQPLPGFSIIPDTNKINFSIRYNWLTNTAYNLVMLKEAFADSAGLTLSKNDTIKFSTRRDEDYGSIKLRFNNLDVSKNPVLQIVQGDDIIESVRLTQRDWSRKYFRPGEYELRILYDANKNGQWDTGKFFGMRRQPEIVQTLKSKLAIRANWDNEKEISLTP